MNKYERRIKKDLEGKFEDFDTWLEKHGELLPERTEEPEAKEIAVPKKKIAVFILGGIAVIIIAAILWFAIGMNGSNNYADYNSSSENGDNISSTDPTAAESGEEMTEEEILSFAEEYAFLKKFDVNSAKTYYAEDGIIYSLDLYLNAESGEYIVTVYFADIGGATDDENFEDLSLSLTVGDYMVYYSSGASSDETTSANNDGTTSANGELYTYYIKSDLGEKTAYIKAETTCASAQTAIYEIFK